MNASAHHRFQQAPRRFRQARGAAVVELAILLVFLLLLTIGITEIGRGFWYYSAMQKAAREGARCLSNQKWDASAPVGGCQSLVRDDANSAGVWPALTLANVQFDCGGGNCSWGSGAAPEYVRVAIVNYRMRWLWSLGYGLPDAGQDVGLQTSAAMPYMR